MKAATKPFCTKLNLQNDIALFFYSAHVTPLHRHNALQSIFDLKNKFLFRTNNTSWSKHKCLIIKEGTPHQISTNNSLQLILYLDKANPLAKSISEKYLINNCFYEPDINLSLMEEILLQRNLLNPNDAAVNVFTNLFLNRIICFKEVLINDNRIISILDFIKEMPSTDLSIKSLADKIFLSPSRLRTLFRNCMNFPLHKYILHHKILAALTEMANGHTIQDAVYYAGFNDNSHFNKMLKKMFNTKPSYFLKENSYNSEINKSKFIFKTELV